MKVFPYRWYLKAFSPLGACWWWWCSVERRVKARPHSPQACSFLPLWMAWCLTRCERYLKLLSHISHAWALSPSVFLSWVPKEGVGSLLTTLLGTFFFGGCPVCSVSLSLLGKEVLKAL